ncbi:2Fe-2S iron-sulfur cluster-binding protein [Rosistilla carotiformis]|uniref:2Fe-2S iron-sulfur cluster-binding protein n=1 Tax=Rosistilla carotiformis TaxID=2528017 RepID=UPI003703E77F
MRFKPVPTIRFSNTAISCDAGDNLRKVLLRSKAPVYNGIARVVNCRGMGVCGMCAVRLRGSVSWPSRYENALLNLVPGAGTLGLRLACLCTVHGDVSVEKFGGVWGTDTAARRHFGRKPTSAELPTQQH